ncbi:unnamed protein product [Trichobilharzia regenti]|nr:unnamed protein product [Trichobilharzia regenti]
MQQEFSDVENSFRKLASYAVTSDLKSKIDQALKSITILESENMIQDFMNASSPYCGVCLSSINPTDGQCINNPVNESSISSSSSSASPSPLQHANGHKRQKHLNHCLAHINLAGCYYHIPCANFWMNCVELCLPALKLPSVCI